MIGPGFAYKTCDCEDFPCCGHNDIDPGWEPDPYDVEDDFYEDYDEGPDDDADKVVECAAWVHEPGRDGERCMWCLEPGELNVDGSCRPCFEPF